VRFYLVILPFNLTDAVSSSSLFSCNLFECSIFNSLMALILIPIDDMTGIVVFQFRLGKSIICNCSGNGSCCGSTHNSNHPEGLVSIFNSTKKIS
jgi:hypothetical protein